MNGRAYYNEIDAYAAQWLRNLIAAGLIAPGDVDERDIRDVRAADLAGYAQCHFFAGIGGWSLALRLAGWPDDRPVWTGSCPCQPFSAAGAGKAADDERHLWPAWVPLIAERRPAIVFGEQVEAAIGWGWLDAVFADLEAEGYACGAAVLPACSIGAPHIRQRCWFVADAGSSGVWRGAESARPSEARELAEYEVERQARRGNGLGRRGASRILADAQCTERRALDHACGDERGNSLSRGQEGSDRPGGGGEDGGMADTASGGQREFGDAPRSRRSRHTDGGFEPGIMGDANGTGEHRQPGWQGSSPPTLEGEMEGQHGERSRLLAIGTSADGALVNAERGRRQGSFAGLAGSCGEACSRRREQADGAARPGPFGNFWSNAEWIACSDGKSRPVGPGSFPLGHGIPNRTSKLRAYGNAIVPQVAAEFIAAFLEAEGLAA